MEKKIQKVIDGPTLFNAFFSGARAVIKEQGYLNKINVFPVPDGDTGTNLASTMKSIKVDSRVSVHRQDFQIYRRRSSYGCQR
jgi:dihydroxyacetone kinase-like predicted kinase